MLGQQTNPGNQGPHQVNPQSKAIKQAPNQPQPISVVKRTTAANQNYSQNSTPKGKKVIISINQQQQQYQQLYLQQQQQVPQFQQRAQTGYKDTNQQLFDNRKRSVETQQYQQQQQQQIHSKSTKVSPQRLSTAPYSQKYSNPLQAKLANQGYDEPVHIGAARKSNGQQDHHFVNSQLNTIQYYNCDIEGLPPALISHTAGAPIKAGAISKKDIASNGSNNILNQYNHGDDMNMDASMHQSFINLIYPSKSKKMMSSDQTAQEQANALTHSGLQLSSQAQQPSSHHHKSKSLYVGGNQSHLVQNFVKPVAHQLAPKNGNGGVQKIQNSQYKKQQNIFNYSQRFKELLNETIGEDASQQQYQKANSQQHHQLFSQQHSPSAAHTYAQNHIMVNFNDIHLQRSVNQPSDPQKILVASTHLKNTFDKPLVSQSHQPTPPGNQYLSISEQAMLVGGGALGSSSNQLRAEINKTIDYTQPSNNNAFQQAGYTKQSNGLHNTPNTNPSKGGSGTIVMQSKSKVVAEPVQSMKQQQQHNLLAVQDSLHQRKPSHPVTNNFMLELLTGPPVTSNHLVSSFGHGNHHQIDLSQSRPDHQRSAQQNHYSQYQQLQPVRKQHQPTQGKSKAVTGNHQRSASDYIQQQDRRLSNGESYDDANNGASGRYELLRQMQQQEDMIESFENLDHTTVTHSGQVNLNNGVLESNRAPPSTNSNTASNSFMQQAFSQLLYDGGDSNQLSHRHQAPNSYPFQNVNSIPTTDKGQLLSAAQSSATIYHQRKLSLQQPITSSSSHTLQVKKSPSKGNIAQKILVGGGEVMESQQINYQKISQKRRSSPSAAQHHNMVSQQQNYINSQPNNSKLANTGASQKGAQILIKNSSIPQQQHNFVGGSMRGSLVSSPTNKTQKPQAIVGHHTSSQTSIGNGQPLPQQFNQPHHNRSNSDIMKQQILAAQNAAIKKQPLIQQQAINRPNPAINKQQAVTPLSNAVQQKAKSEITTPRQIQAKNIHHAKKMSQIVGSATANVSIDLVKGQNTQRGTLAKNGSSSNLATHQRKDSNQQTPRLKQQSPPYSKLHIKSTPQDMAVSAKPTTQQFQAAVKRYSVQNSPRAAQKQSSGGQYNLSQQYQMFQQVMAKQQAVPHKNKTETVSPSNSKNSFSNGQTKRSSVGGITSSKSGILEAPQEEHGGHKRGVSETEFLLNQIRNNINTLKAYQPYPEPAPYQPVKNLQRITEASTEHMAALEPSPFDNGTRKELTKYKRDNIVLAEDSTQNIPTDPSMSPYSKDLSKLQKLIRFNFRKFNEPPATTSEFYRIGRVLGRGAFGKVNLAAHKLSEQLVAIKSINKEFLRSSKRKEEQVEGGDHPEKKKVMQEFAILKQSNHQSVVRLYDTFETSKHICFVMELCAGGDLLTYVRKRRKLSEEVAKYFFKQLIEGLAYLHHSKLIVHRDIKLDNILLDANGRIKIADFGVSRQVQTEQERMSEQCGTPAYIAPEILKDKGYEGFKVDVWSAGVCLYAMLIGTVPFKAASMQELHHLIINGKYDVNNPNANCTKDGNNAAQQQQPQTKLTEHAVNLIHSLLQVDPRKRLSAVEVLSHPWLKDAKEELDIFTQKEKDVIHKEYLSKNIDRAITIAKEKDMLGTGQLNFQDDNEVIFTEHNLDTRTNVGSLLKNASTKSIILAPFNSTVSELNEAGEEGKDKAPYQWPQEILRMIVPKRVLKFAPKVKDLDRQYEHNNNADLDNGVYNNIGNEDDPANNPIANNSQDSAISSQDSLKRSFKETELSSDDEKAEIQLEEARKKQQQQSELKEFEKQIKLKYVRYQEPVEIIDVELINQIGSKGSVYPRDFLLRTLQTKEMNYATATYHLLLKKQQQLAKY